MQEPTDSIILIGPYGAGKSTLADLLSEHLNLPTESLDLHQHYYAEAGFDRDEFRHLIKGPTPLDADLYFQTFFPHALERILADYPHHIIDLGAGHTVYQDEVLFERVRQTLSPYPNVVLVLPSPDPDASIKILRDRVKERPGSSYFLDHDFDFFSHWVKSHCNADLAKITIYTEGKTPEQSTNELIQLLTQQKTPA